jgi:hypothetical protein
MTKDGSGEIVTITPRGIGHMKDGGKVSIRGSVFFNTKSTEGKLTFLNNLVGVFEYEVDDLGNTAVKVWEWK